jgi:hypothetical protein
MDFLNHYLTLLTCNWQIPLPDLLVTQRTEHSTFILHVKKKRDLTNCYSCSQITIHTYGRVLVCVCIYIYSQKKETCLCWVESKFLKFIWNLIFETAPTFPIVT